MLELRQPLSYTADSYIINCWCKFVLIIIFPLKNIHCLSLERVLLNVSSSAPCERQVFLPVEGWCFRKHVLLECDFIWKCFELGFQQGKQGRWFPTNSPSLVFFFKVIPCCAESHMFLSPRSIWSLSICKSDTMLCFLVIVFKSLTFTNKTKSGCYRFGTGE